MSGTKTRIERQFGRLRIVLAAIGMMAGATIVVTIGAMVGGAPASAQMMSDSYKFLEAVRKSDGAAVSAVVERPGTTLVNTRDRTSGETALIIVTKRRDTSYMRYLLGHGGRADIASNDGRFPLMISVEQRFPEGVEVLLANNANVNQSNGRGETALIRAVQLQDVGMVRLLVANGADPARRDTLAGMSARDYAERDAKVPGMIEALNAAKPRATTKAMQGPSL